MPGFDPETLRPEEEIGGSPESPEAGVTEEPAGEPEQPMSSEEGKTLSEESPGESPQAEESRPSSAESEVESAQATVSEPLSQASPQAGSGEETLETMQMGALQSAEEEEIKQLIEEELRRTQQVREQLSGKIQQETDVPIREASIERSGSESRCRVGGRTGARTSWRRSG